MVEKTPLLLKKKAFVGGVFIGLLSCEPEYCNFYLVAFLSLGILIKKILVETIHCTLIQGTSNLGA